jgi:hypothetical protein
LLSVMGEAICWLWALTNFRTKQFVVILILLNQF